ncbi:unnamed protein product [Ceratitis capitata]|uniref:(Mediterranean fruit fly) hypothetical protein n=1 Tax=Ceratitis capitata TaxID=7213 RepID=A0A811UK26_CERCA|nr:unnamed protein product [Ceratitis capitata]
MCVCVRVRGALITFVAVAFHPQSEAAAITTIATIPLKMQFVVRTRVFAMNCKVSLFGAATIVDDRPTNSQYQIQNAFELLNSLRKRSVRRRQKANMRQVQSTSCGALRPDICGGEWEK